MSQDRVFDGLSQRFQRTIYANHDPRGMIRLHITQDDLSKLFKNLPPTHQALDIGAGLGQMSLWLAEQGWTVTLSEPSAEMLTQAQALVQNSAYTQQIELLNHSIQTLPSHYSQHFDLIICHAVLEWLAEPQTTLQTLTHYLKPDGYLSLMFFNRTSTEFRHLIAGNLDAVLEQRIASDGQKGLAPISPLLPDEVLSWLPELGLELVQWSGIRCFYDYTYHKIRKTLPLDKVIQLERHYSQIEPWRSLARYQHFILKKLK
ncbi:methyltransferase domain-containing protein [Thiofilum flexile]|uniref:methyltransferase domain-containing protein n=1 Tax=Thiofilum flexile TaxID=125627 RepID=UPI000377D2EA|nr:methyltransferase domain-containing protein [Thiofilum flexile]